MSLSSEEKQRYSRHLILDGFGETAQLRLKRGSVLVVGAGGLGCPALLYLAAAGVGHLGVADDDTVSFSNLQRQVLFNTADQGRRKVEVAREKILAKNSNIRVSEFDHRITPENALEILKSFDVVIDASDNMATRYLLNDACVILKKPLVYGALFKFEGQVSTFNYEDGPTYRCLFPETPGAELVPGCGEIGVLGVLPGIIGTYQAAEAIKILTGVGEPLAGKLLVMNLLSNDVSIMKFRARAENKTIERLGEYALSCTPPDIISAEQLRELRAREDVQVLDVREPNEFEAFNIGGWNLPLSQLNENLDRLDTAKVTVVVCQSGVRSEKAVGIIRKQYPGMRLLNLEGGLSAYSL